MTAFQDISPFEGRHIQADPVPAATFDLAAIPPEWWKITDEDLDCGNEERLPNQLHGLQITMLTTPLEIYYQDRPDVYVAGEMFVYFSPLQILTEVFKGPDVFVALNSSKRVRNSWVTWQEGKPPDLVIEILSTSTAAGDKKPKKYIYQDRLKVPEYIWFNPRNGHVGAFELAGGEYRPIEPDSKRRIRSRRLDLLLVRWKGEYRGVEERWLRWATLDGTLLPTSDEIAEQERHRAHEERHRADEERHRAEEERRRTQSERERADRLAARLWELGIDPGE